jgi:hypothetical protein
MLSKIVEVHFPSEATVSSRGQFSLNEYAVSQPTLVVKIFLTKYGVVEISHYSRDIAPTIFFCVRFEVFTAVTMKNTVVWDVVPCTSCVNRLFGGTYRLHLQGRKINVRITSVKTVLRGKRF